MTFCKSYLIKFSVTLIFLSILSSCANSNSDKLIKDSSAPEISLPDNNGKTLILSSLKGKVVLVHFWASWCKPCREENPELVALYNKYKDASFEKTSGFTIFSVSLDTNKEKW